ncbi:peptidase M28 [Bacillus sp. FJAT-27231]|uniref:M20/M25/M40 family metallo-hydrolase n=1 Tax=Bacillus sp. FJAT-27231 TaxID=1679168 RepID=UPI000671646F|nr:M20/M25/M40 family metallo-hydrolase [Bacillus sp. FJAT-27231]KMY55301.1 peptidase M28 [Bacillus sp. FJAT-27231]
MKSWNRLFIRQGFMVEEKEANKFFCWTETEKNIDFLLESLAKLSVEYSLEQGILTIMSPAVSEEEWLRAVSFKHRGGGEWAWFHPGEEEPKIKELDTYISGVVRHLNRLGLHTTYSCDGHERRNPSIEFAEWVDMERASKVLHAAGVSRLLVRNRNIKMLVGRNQLLSLAENLNKIEKAWLDEEVDFIKKQLFFHQLEQCLSINGKSGNEGKIREFVMQELNQYVDHMTVDHAGNVLAQKVCGTGHGPVILLNAHLDTVDTIEDDRNIMKEGTIWSSSKGILGADDRAGVAVLLEMARRLQECKFNGKIKFIFTVEEEVGLVGARSVNEYFLWDVNAAFVVDRRGTGDIVTSCGGYEAFCDERYGTFIEEAAEKQGLTGWRCTKGGSSDTRVWASHGIQSVNLSAGYQNEHTSSETLDVEACYQTVQLLIGVLHQARDLQRVIRQITIGRDLSGERAPRVMLR